MGILLQSHRDSNSIISKSKIPDCARNYKNEYLFIRGINKSCEKFLKLLDEEGKILKSPQANKIKFFFNKFLKAHELEYLKDISYLFFKESDVKFIESLELQLDDYMDLFYDSDSYKFDQEKYENDNLGLKEFFESFSKFKDKIKIEEMTFSDFKNSLNYLDSDSDSDSDSD